MAQEQLLQYGSITNDDLGSRYFYNQGSASSILAATAFGVHQNPLATPSNLSNYSSSSNYSNYPWRGHHSVSPSIWSAGHQSSAQWPANNRERFTSAVVCNSGVNSFCYPRGYFYEDYSQQPAVQPVSRQIPQQVAGPHQIPQNIVSAAPNYQYNAPIQQPVVPQPITQHVHMANPHMVFTQPLPQMANSHQVVPYYVPCQQLPPHLQAFTRAPIPQYRHVISPSKELQHAQTEYDLQSFVKFSVAVFASIFHGCLTTNETISLEQFMEMLLSATHLPKSTLLMSFVFLNQWPKLESTIFQEVSLETRIVCSLVLANKMNDDNTFTNASWGLVTKIAPSRITALELAWLDGLDWKMNLDQSGIEEWNHWDRCWQRHEEAARNAYLQSPMSPSVWSTGLVLESFPVAAC